MKFFSAYLVVICLVFFLPLITLVDAGSGYKTGLVQESKNLSGAAKPADGENLPDLEKTSGQVDENTIGFIQSEIDKIRQDLQWLSSRVEKMEAFNQFVPEKMIKSLEFKKNKIQILTTLNGKYEDVLKKEKEKGPEPDKEGPRKFQVAEPAALPTCNGESIEDRISQFGLKDWLDVVKDQDRYRIENRLPLLFASGSARIANEYDIFLDNLALVLKDCPMNVFVDGYADIDPINTTKYPSNFELGAVRAANVVHALIKKGMDPSMFKIGSTGRYRFAGHEASEWKALERHVNITVVLEP